MRTFSLQVTFGEETHETPKSVCVRACVRACAIQTIPKLVAAVLSTSAVLSRATSSSSSSSSASRTSSLPHVRFRYRIRACNWTRPGYASGMRSSGCLLHGAVDEQTCTASVSGTSIWYRWLHQCSRSIVTAYDSRKRSGSDAGRVVFLVRLSMVATRLLQMPPEAVIPSNWALNGNIGWGGCT